MEYSIGQVAKMFGISISTLRYYDSEGLFNNLERKSGIRKFQEKEIDTLRVIQCLKKSGLEIKEIKHFIDLCSKGKETYQERKEIFEKQRRKVEMEIAKLNETMDMLNFKCWYYEQAIKDGNEIGLENMKKNGFPKGVDDLYKRSHKEFVI